VIDILTLIGSTPRLTAAAEYALPTLVGHARQHGVSDALVAARSSRHEIANNQVLEAAGSTDGVRLHPVATLNPVQYMDWRAELERVIAAGAVALRFFPDTQRWSVGSQVFSEIVEAIAGRCPILVPVTQFGDATAIGAATAERGRPVVLVGGHYTQLGDCLAALERWPHLYLETSRLAQFRGVETVVRAAGAKRVLFGSDAPARPIQAPLNAILTADIPDADKSLILAGNASGLFGLPLAPVALPQPTTAEHLIDVHAHIGALGLPTPRIDPHQHPEMAARFGIDLSIGSSLHAIADDATIGNGEAFAAIRAGLLAYVVVSPNDLEASCRALDTAYAADQAVGAKLHCGYTGQPTASRACMDLLHEVARRGRPLKIHVEGAGWDDALACVALAHPRWKVIVAHAGPGAPDRAVAGLVERTPNVYAELSTSFPDLATTREVVQRVGPDRLLFGSDAPLLDPAYALGLYADAGADLRATSAVAKEVFGL